MSGLRSYLVETDVYYGWFVVAACFVSGFVIYGVQYSFSVFFGHIVADFGLSHANTASVFSVQSLLLYCGAAVLGFGLDRYDVRQLFFLATALVGVGLAGTGLTSSYLGLLLTYGLLTGIGFSILMVVSYVTPVLWFARRRGIAVGIATSGAGVGMVVAPPAAQYLIGLYGWQPAYVVISVLVVVALSVAGLLVAGRPARIEVDRTVEFDEASHDRTNGSPRDQIASVKNVVQTWPFALFFLAYLAAYVPPFALTVNFVEYAESVGLGEGIGVLSLSVVGATNALGKPLFGYVADRTKTVYAIALSALLAGVLLAPLALIRHPRIVVGISVLFGLGFGGLGALMGPAIIELFDDRNPNAVFGIASISTAVSTAAGPYLASLSFDVYGTFVPAFVGLSTLGVLAAALVVAVKALQDDAEESK